MKLLCRSDWGVGRAPCSSQAQGSSLKLLGETGDIPAIFRPTREQGPSPRATTGLSDPRGFDHLG